MSKQFIQNLVVGVAMTALVHCSAPSSDILGSVGKSSSIEEDFVDSSIAVNDTLVSCAYIGCFKFTADTAIVS